MKGKIFFYSILALLLFSAVDIFASKREAKELPESYRKWLKEEVVYIITPREKKVFLQLESDKEKNIFIEAFWKQRNPNPNIPGNEFKKEHYRRISYANQWFGRESPGPGWRKAMGRIYIILGEPNFIEKYENLSEVQDRKSVV